MKKSIMVAVVGLGLLSGCAVGPEVIRDQAGEAGALKAYHRAERTAVRADKAVKVAGGALVAATAIKMKADADLAKAKDELDNTLNE